MGRHDLRRGPEHRRATLPLENVKPFIGIWMPMHFAHCAGLDDDSSGGDCFGRKKICAVTELNRTAFGLPDRPGFAQAEDERVGGRSRCGRRLRLNRRKRWRHGITLINPAIMYRDILKGFRRHAEVLCENTRRRVGDPIRNQQSVKLGRLPLSNAMTNSQPSSPSPCKECGNPAGKYQRSPSLTSATCGRPNSSMMVTRHVPYVMIAHSAC